MKSRKLRPSSFLLFAIVVYATSVLPIVKSVPSFKNNPPITSSPSLSSTSRNLYQLDDELIQHNKVESSSPSSSSHSLNFLTSPSSILSYLFPVWFTPKSDDGKSISKRSKRWASPGSSPPLGLAKLIALDVICGKDSMTVRAEFNGPFNGIVFSKGTYGQDNCIYVKPYSGVTHTTFKVNYDSCGTKPDLQGKYYENTIVVQYGSDIIEAWDEAKRLRCEWFEAYEKPATFRPAIPVADLDVIEMNFQGDDIDCWMEIQEGKGPWAREVNRIVPVGQPMTIVVAINDYNGQFDMRVKSCFAHDGIKPPIHLTDEHGCVLRPKMLSSFNKIKDPNGKATVISYSHFYAFKFPDTMNVQIQCTVEVCRHGCPDACQKGPYPTPVREIHPKVQLGASASNIHHHHQPPPQPPQQPREQPPKVKDDEPKPVYQDVNRQPSQQSGVHLPGIGDQTIVHHATQFLADQGIDLSSLAEGVDSQSSNSSHANHNNHNHNNGDLASSASSPHITEDENKPVIKVVEIDVPEDKKKPPMITEQTSMFPSDLNHANKILQELGLNMDLNSFASSIMKNPKELSSILQNDNVKQLANAAGFNLNNVHVSSLLSPQASQPIPQAQPLINSSSVSSLFGSDVEGQPNVPTTKFPGSIEEHETTTAINRTTPQPNIQYSPQYPSSIPPQVHHHRPVYISQQQQGHNVVIPHQGHPHHLHHAGQHQHQHITPITPPSSSSDQPIVQVLNVPMSPIGLPPGSIVHSHHPPQMSPQFTTFVHLPPNAQIPPPKLPKRPFFNIPSLIPSFTSVLNPFVTLNSFSHSKDRVDDPNGPQVGQSIAQARSGDGPNGNNFPQGPRSFRLKRSTNGGHGHHHQHQHSRRSFREDSQVSVHKGFQVVTAIDLAFLPNATTDHEPEIFEGRPDSEVIYGSLNVCMPMIGFVATITCIVLIIVFSIVFSIIVSMKISRIKSNKNNNHKSKLINNDHRISSSSNVISSSSDPSINSMTSMSTLPTSSSSLKHPSLHLHHQPNHLHHSQHNMVNG